jgi:predicted porin
MQKKIIALAVAATMTAPALALADGVEVYGKADLALAHINNGSTTANQVTSQITKLGFKGSENLGDGNNVIWQIEQQIDINNAGAGNSSHTTFAGRNSFLGMQGDSWGTLMVGRHDTPYKEADRNLDVFGDQFADNRHLMGGGVSVPIAANNNKASLSSGFGSYMDARPGNEIMYNSPDMNGFKVSGAYVFVNDLTQTPAAATPQVKGNLWSVSARYEAGALFADLAYQNDKFESGGSQYTATGNLAAGDSLKAWKAGIGYHVTDAFKVNAVYERVTSSVVKPLATFDSNELGRNDWYLAGQYDFGSDDVKLAYTRAGDTDGHADTGANMIGVGYDHNMSKRTSLYVQYNRLSNDSNAVYAFNTQATTGGMYAGSPGAKLDGFLVGMKHTF